MRRILCSVFAISVMSLACSGCGSSPDSATPDGGVPPDAGPTGTVLDLQGLETTAGGVRRVRGSVGTGESGVPVAAGGDCDGDDLPDVALAAFLADPFGRGAAGEVYLVFGDGTTHGEIDTAPMSAGVLKIAGAGGRETLGNEVWIDDVTGDGVADLLLCRQNFRPDVDRPGAGALTILVGGPSLREHAETLTYVDLLSPPESLTLTTFVGAAPIDRLGIWVRTADVTGDNIADIIVGADQEDGQGANSGAVYVIRGGAHLAVDQTIDLFDFGSTAIAGHIAKVVPPEVAPGYHLGATCDGADLDGNGRAEVLVSAALQRSGATIGAVGTPPGSAQGSGGTENGTLFIAWDDNFVGDMWPAGFTVALDDAPGDVSVIDGAARNVAFGEELNGDVDFDSDGNADLFVGDLIGDFSTDNRPSSGVGHVLYNAPAMRGLSFDMDNLPAEVQVTTILGAAAGDISSDTSIVGDFDGDSVSDLAVGSPSADPIGRQIAGTIHVLFGQTGRWPAIVDLREANSIPQADVRITSIYGANGTQGADLGDMICYSAAGGDLDGDGRDDIVSNEMLGNGLAPTALDVGNLVVIGGTLFE